MLNPHPTSVGAARRFVRDVLLARHIDDSVVRTVELLTVRVAVRDLSPEVPRRRLASVDDVSGRGVVIVEQLASAWGVQRELGGGKQVWFEVAC